MVKTLLGVLVCFCSATSLAQVSGNPADLALVKKVVPKGKSIAREYQIKNNLNGDGSVNYTEQEQAEILASSYVVYDINKDGIKDIYVVIEETVCSEDLIAGKCPQESYYGWTAKNRTLQVYFGQKNGSYKLMGYSQNLMLNDGDGGAAMRDPLESLTIDENGFLSLGYWGGSALKWGHNFKIQYRQAKNGKYGFYIVESQNMYMDWAGDFDSDNRYIVITTTTKNFLTGEQKTVTQELGEDEAGEEEVAESKKIQKKLTDRFGKITTSVFQ